ncbi:hypothetical protein BDB01DRAFT_838240 [Pilobolus umbonatus]|nr:hypothetical protein BDB01DRAFT_838240 [Pilobolus umbonatus]
METLLFLSYVFTMRIFPGFIALHILFSHIYFPFSLLIYEEFIFIIVDWALISIRGDWGDWGNQLCLSECVKVLKIETCLLIKALKLYYFLLEEHEDIFYITDSDVSPWYLI